MPESPYSTNGDESSGEKPKDIRNGEKEDDADRRESAQDMKTLPGGQGHYTEDGRRIITEDEAWDHLGYTWPTWKKWMLLSSIFAVQVSMNFNTSVYPNVITPLSEHFGIPETTATYGQWVFLITYAFGCELWAPWSEEFGRWPVLQ